MYTSLPFGRRTRLTASATATLSTALSAALRMALRASGATRGRSGELPSSACTQGSTGERKIDQ